MNPTLGLKSYKAYGAPQFWRLSEQMTKGGFRNMGRSYHGHAYNPWGWGRYGFRGYHRRGGFLGYLAVGTIGFWFGRHYNSEHWEKRRHEHRDKFNKAMEEVDRHGWEFKRKHHQEQPVVAENAPGLAAVPSTECSEKGTGYGFWRN